MRYSDDPKASCWSSIQERQNQRNDANLRTWRQHIAYHQQPAAAQLWQKKLSLNLKGKKKEKRRILLLLFPSTSTGIRQSSSSYTHRHEAATRNMTADSCWHADTRHEHEHKQKMPSVGKRGQRRKAQKNIIDLYGRKPTFPPKEPRWIYKTAAVTKL